MTELAKSYDPSGVEDRWYAFWRDGGYFKGQTGAAGEPLSIVIPPPNVTGVLHMGHALNSTLQDIIVRRARMMGRPTTWVPGTDHAGIATQNVVERRLAEEGKSRHDLGREAFVDRVWEWKQIYEARILSQMAKLGCSCDWDLTRFTMDEGLSLAVRTMFVRLFDEGHIYRGNRIINWCPRCTTALSDIEVKHSEREGELVTIRYPIEGGGHIDVATTRVETMLGDTGVAVHPADERYTSFVGKFVILPLTGRRIPIVADDVIDPTFGTGAVKVTPAHDPNDFEIGRRHNLEQINIFTEQAVVNEEGGQFAGMDRFAARKAALEALRGLGAIVDEQRPYLHSVGHCDRCGTVVEPWLSEQWFVSMAELVKPAIAAVESGEIKIVPEQPFKKTYLDWMNNIRDWCISRQLWWGHRIPVWYCDNGHMFAALEDPTECRECASSNLEQDADVLDTWFSSQLWPFSTLGWPEKTADLEYWYPTTVLVTAYEILYLWVARMIVAGLHVMGEVPFRRVLIHGIVRDFEGKKMSKSVGNTVDPLDIIARYGTDALRFSLARSAIPGQDTNVAEEWIEGDRRFANKIWNASRFVLSNLEGLPEPVGASEFGLPERWILSRLAQTQTTVEAAIEAYQFAEASRCLYQFMWTEFCDWYLELSKLSLNDTKLAPAARYVLHTVLETTLRLLHPFMPFITEELWQQLPKADGSAASIMISPWPTPDTSAFDESIEAEMSLLQAVVIEIRRFRHEHGISPRTKIDAILVGPTASDVLTHSTVLEAMAGLSSVKIGTESPGAGWSKLLGAGMEIYVPLTSVADPAAEIERLKTRLLSAEKQVSSAKAKLDKPGFVDNAPEAVVFKVRAQLADEVAKVDKLKAQIEELDA